MEQYEEDKTAHSFDSMRPMTAARHMLEVRAFMMQFREFISQPATASGALAVAAYSPVRAVQGRGAARTSYASELASQQRSFQHLEATVARMEPSGQPEGVQFLQEVQEVSFLITPTISKPCTVSHAIE